MPEQLTWDVLMRRALATSEGKHIAVQCNDCLLMLERRASVLIAMREITAEQLQRVAEQSSGHHTPFMQLLKIGERRYLSAWRRSPTDADWIMALASVQL